MFVVVVGLTISMAILLGLIVFAFLDVALAGPRLAVASSRRWQPPLARGEPLADWAAGMAQAATTQRLSAGPTAGSAKQLVADIFEGARFAIAQSPSAVVQSAPQCASCRHQMIGVTVPEVLAIADEIRQTKSIREVQRIHDRAAHNSDTVAGMDRQQYEQAGVACPLLAADDSCAVFDARPLRCRGWCRFSGEDGDRCLLGGGDHGPLDAHALTVARGAEDGLSRGLKSVGLDGNEYELNSALATALETPAAAGRWAAGETAFQGCKRFT